MFGNILSDGLLEDDAAKVLQSAGNLQAAMAAVSYSQAISLKRIADALTNPHSVTGNFEDMAFHMGKAFEAGRRNG